MATTSPDNIWTPDSGDDYALTVDLARTADDVQDAITSLRNARRYRSGTTTERDAWSAPGWGAMWGNTTTGELYIYTTVWKRFYKPRTPWSPGWSNLVTGAGSVTAWYEIIGNTCRGYVKVVLGSGLALNNSGVMMSPPVAAANASDGMPVGTATYIDSGVGYWSGALIADGAGNLRLMHTKNGGSGSYGGVTATEPTSGWSVGDQILLQFSYEVA